MQLLQLDKCRKLVQFAERCLKEGTDYFYGIEACNEVLDGHTHEIGPTLKHDCLCTRAALLLKVLQGLCWITFFKVLCLGLQIY